MQFEDRRFSTVAPSRLPETGRLVSIDLVAVEKLFRAKIDKNRIASECVISDVLKFRDISYPGFFPVSG